MGKCTIALMVGCGGLWWGGPWVVRRDGNKMGGNKWRGTDTCRLVHRSVRRTWIFGWARARGDCET
jgi:ribosome modulation factor